MRTTDGADVGGGTLGTAVCTAGLGAGARLTGVEAVARGGGGGTSKRAAGACAIGMGGLAEVAGAMPAVLTLG